VCHNSHLLLPACCEGFPFPQSLVLRAPCPLCSMSFFVIAYYSVFFFFFSLGGGWSVQGAMLIWTRIVCGSTVCCLSHLVVRIFPSHLVAAICGGVGALLVSPFNMKWRCYAQAGGVEESKFCLFLVVFPVRCISSVSPRFYFRRHAFCFLPLATILESPREMFSTVSLLYLF
jgi:hypothetical protein